jgi:hypothetical protein
MLLSVVAPAHAAGRSDALELHQQFAGIPSRVKQVERLWRCLQPVHDMERHGQFALCQPSGKGCHRFGKTVCMVKDHEAAYNACRIRPRRRCQCQV